MVSIVFLVSLKLCFEICCSIAKFEVIVVEKIIGLFNYPVLQQRGDSLL